VILLAFIATLTAGHAMLLAAPYTKLGHIIRQTIPDRPHRPRMFLCVSQLIVLSHFLAVRLLAPPFSTTSGLHRAVPVRHHGRPPPSHLTTWFGAISDPSIWVGYGYLNEVGSDATPASIFASRLMSIPVWRGRPRSRWMSLRCVLNLATLYVMVARGWRESIRLLVVLFGTYCLAIGTWRAPLYTRDYCARNNLSRLTFYGSACSKRLAIHPRASSMQTVVYCGRIGPVLALEFTRINQKEVLIVHPTHSSSRRRRSILVWPSSFRAKMFLK